MTWARDRRGKNADRFTRELKIRQASDSYDGHTLLWALGRKVKQRLLRRTTFQIKPTAEYNGILVFDRADLDGGGRDFGQDYHRVLREVRPEGCGRLFELCAGPGYIGYSLLATGFCRQLVLADINRVAIKAARKTAEFNKLGSRVTIYQSDGLRRIPPSERWDVVVGNPPHFLPDETKRSLLLHDKDWNLHRDFYTNIKKYLNPAAIVCLQENTRGSDPAIFEPWIKAGGGALDRCIPGPDYGSNGRIYYLVCKYA
jgi:16S rRNA G966 N2-methylase RsmD